MTTSEDLHTCPVCQRKNFTAAGLRSHRCGPKKQTPAETVREILLDHPVAATVPAPAPESHLAKVAREMREARAAGTVRPLATSATSPVMPRTKLKRRKVREVIVEVEKKPLMLKVGELDFHPHLKRVGLLPDLIERETQKGNDPGHCRDNHKGNAAELSDEFEALKLSILGHGVREPLKVVKNAKGKWLIVDGRHRYLAVKDIVQDNGPLSTSYILNPAHMANADKLTQDGMPCVEIQESEVKDVILDAVKRRHLSKGALAYLAVLLNPKIAAEAKRGGDRKSKGRKELLITDATLGARIIDFAKSNGVSETTMKRAIYLFKLFDGRDELRLKCEPGVWVGNALEYVIDGAESIIKFGFDPKKTDETPEQKAERLAGEYAVHTMDRLTKLEVTLRNWEAMLPEGRASVIARTVEVLGDAPADLRQAILTGLRS